MYFDTVNIKVSLMLVTISSKQVLLDVTDIIRWYFFPQENTHF